MRCFLGGLSNRRILLRVRDGDGAVGKHVQGESSVNRGRNIGIDEGHRLAVRQLRELLLLDVRAVEGLVTQFLAKIGSLGADFDALVVVLLCWFVVRHD
jgi:hypothetical protein